MATGRRWTRDELLVVLNLYHKLTFGQLHDIVLVQGQASHQASTLIVGFIMGVMLLDVGVMLFFATFSSSASSAKWAYGRHSPPPSRQKQESKTNTP
jgi:hypothetical protein